MTCNVQLLAPLIGLTIDTKLFCQSIFRSRLLFVLVVGYTSYACIGVLTSPSKAFLLLGLSHDIPQQFCYEWFGTTVCGILTYALVINGARRILHRVDQRRTHPS